MGLPIQRENFEDADYAAFSQRLSESLAVLEELLGQTGFGEGAHSLGAELEVSIIDASARALPLDRRELPSSLDEHISLELDRFNLEYNLAPVGLAGAPFSALGNQLALASQILDQTAGERGGRVAAIGILPTLQLSDLKAHAMTDLPRYRALAAALRRLRAGPFRIDIDGPEPLTHECESVVLEGAGTSFQIHLRVPPDKFADFYNAAQLSTPIALAVSANSPIFLERRLWHETRIALFKQSIDSRPRGNSEWTFPARVSFGHGWLRRGAQELFEEAVALFPPLLPVMSDEDPREALKRGQLPELEELRLHQGTVWRWNRAIFDPGSGGHLRIELRALPSGPTPLDMAANAAFLVGLIFGLAPEIDHLTTRLPFALAEYSFYRAAQNGLDATLLWPSEVPPGPREVPAVQLAQELLPVAEAGLAKAGIAAD